MAVGLLLDDAPQELSIYIFLSDEEKILRRLPPFVFFFAKANELNDVRVGELSEHRASFTKRRRTSSRR